MTRVSKFNFLTSQTPWSQKGGHKCQGHKRPGHKRPSHTRPGHNRPLTQ